MPDFYFLVRFLAHKDSIVRNRIAGLFLEHRINDDAIPTMVIHSVRSFGVADNLEVVNLLPYQDLTTEQLGFLLAQRENLQKKKSLGIKKILPIIERYDTILKRILISRNFQIVKPFIEELPPEFLKVIYLKKWRQIIYRDLFKLYSAHPAQQLLNRMYDFVNKHKRKAFKRSCFTELRIWAEVFYINFSKVKDTDQKKFFFESTEEYFKGLSKHARVPTVKKKIYPLEACYHLLSAGWWSMEHLIRPIMDIFTLECDEFIYKETVNRLLEFNENQLLEPANELLISGKISEKAFPHFLKLFYLPGDFDNGVFYSRSQDILIAALKHEKQYSRRVLILLTLSDIFSQEFIPRGAELIKSKGHFNFAMGSYGKYKAMLQERLLVHSLLTGEKVEGLESYINSYVEHKTSLIERINTSLFFYKKNDDKE